MGSPPRFPTQPLCPECLAREFGHLRKLVAHQMPESGQAEAVGFRHTSPNLYQTNTKTVNDLISGAEPRLVETVHLLVNDPTVDFRFFYTKSGGHTTLLAPMQPRVNEARVDSRC